MPRWELPATIQKERVLGALPRQESQRQWPAGAGGFPAGCESSGIDWRAPRGRFDAQRILRRAAPLENVAGVRWNGKALACVRGFLTRRRTVIKHAAKRGSRAIPGPTCRDCSRNENAKRGMAP